jgi:steroid delta-isomerase-like uncharacterized protein
MTTEDSQAIIRRYFEAYNQNDVESFHEIFSPDFVCHFGAAPEPMVGLAANLEEDAHFRTAFTDIRWNIDDIFGQGDKVVVRRTWDMTHTGPFQGLPGSGRVLTGTAIDIYRLSAGKVVEQWTESDNLSFMQQLGAMPEAEREPGL